MDPQSKHQPHLSKVFSIQEGKVIGSGDLTARPDRYHEVYKQEL